MNSGPLIIVAVLLLGAPVRAQQQLDWDHAIKQKNLCSSGSMMEMNECLAKEYARADRRMNATNRRLQSELLDPAPLKKAQIAWLRFRDLHCEFHVPKKSEGSLAPYSRNACLIDLTEKRSLDLEAIIPCNGCVLFKPEIYERR
ncbi:MAG: lysozyme inhibitor LprI family protein [Polaromonas sp.]